MTLAQILQHRFGEAFTLSSDLNDNPLLSGMAKRGSCRAFEPSTVPADLLRALCGIALSSPTKSDLQQRDIIIVREKDLRADLVALLPTVTWLDDAPSLLVFCGNNRRQRLIHDRQNHPFANDHLDAFFNAAVDAAIALSSFVTAAEASGLGCCPISAVRNEADAVSDLLKLPDHVFPVAGLAVGYPSQTQPTVSLRLPLDTCVHTDRYDESTIGDAISAYDARRADLQPYTVQRNTDKYGLAASYCWSEDKTRQYSEPERETFGSFIRKKGFNLA